MKKIVSALILGLSLSITSLHADNQKDSREQSIVINLAGKQRMLTQKMSKEALLIAKDINVEQNKKSLKESIALFDKTLKGLYSGDQELHLPKTTDKEILKQLDIVLQQWNSFRKDIEKVAMGHIDKATLESIDKKNIPLLNSMNIVVDMYEEKSKSKLDPIMAKTINLAGRQRMLTQKMTKELLLIANSLKSHKNEQSLKSTGELFKETLTDLILNNKDAMNDPQISQKLANVKNLWNRYQNIIANSTLSDSSNNSKDEQNRISQAITDELLNIASIVDSKVYKENLKKTGELFDKTLQALINGDANLGLMKTEDKKILKQLNRVQELWSQYRDIIANADISDAGLKKAMEINIPLLQAMNQAVNMYEKSIK